MQLFNHHFFSCYKILDSISKVPLYREPLAASDVWSGGCSGPWSRKRHSQPFPQQNGILDIEISSSNSLRIRAFSPLDVTRGGDLVLPFKLGKLRPRKSNKTFPRSHGPGQPRLEPRPQSSLPVVLVIAQHGLPF